MSNLIRLPDPEPPAVERRLPFILGPRRVEPAPELACQQVELRFGRAILPALTREIADEVLRTPAHELAALRVQEIISFLNRLGRQWKNKEYPRRRLFTRQLVQHLGYSERAASAEADWIASLLRSHTRLWDQLETELGNRFLLDEWVRREECYVRAFPRGLSVHLMAGNAPSAAVVSIVRALLTKNAVLIKPSADDLITSLALASSMSDIDPHHPITRNVHVVYWPHDDALGAQLTESAGSVCVWGGNAALDWARRHTAASAMLLPFGPKRSLAVIGRGADLESVALGLAHDIALYDQRACFSVQRVFVARELAEPLTRALQRALERYAELLPPGRRTLDQSASAALTRAADDFLGAAVDHDPNSAWTIVRCAAERRLSHPLGRYVALHEYDDLDEVTPFVDAQVQTVGLAPWDLYRDHTLQITSWASRGVSRFVEVGLSNLFRGGSPHDDMYPMAMLVRYVAVELPASTHGKGMVLPIDQTALLEREEMAELAQ